MTEVAYQQRGSWWIEGSSGQVERRVSNWDLVLCTRDSWWIVHLFVYLLDLLEASLYPLVTKVLVAPFQGCMMFECRNFLLLSW
jgi:hypothetical protein